MRVLANPLKNRTNPYVQMLYDSLRDLGCIVVADTPQEILKGGDVYLVHWPDQVFSGDSLLGSVVYATRLFIKVMIARFRGLKPVWVVHNLLPHRRVHPRWWIATFYCIWKRLVEGKVFLTRAGIKDYESLHGKVGSYVVVPHGHFCRIYENLSSSRHIGRELGLEGASRIVGHYGLISSYKNILELIAAFRKIGDPSCRLVVAGRVARGEEVLFERILAAAQEDSRIVIREGYLEDEEMLELYEFTDLAVLPYSKIFNSGSAILALSLGCPVLVPDTPSMAELQSLVGCEMVGLIEKGCLSESIREALLRGPGRLSCGRQNVASLDWKPLSLKLFDYFESLSRGA